MNPTLSIITPVFNGEKFIHRCYSTLLQQTVHTWEWILVNDGSTDQTHQMIQQIQDDRIRYKSYNQNQGRGFARTEALKMCRAEWIVIWDVDDLYFPERLAKINEARAAGHDFFCSYTVVIDNNFNVKGVRGFLLKDRYLPKGFVHHTLACRTDIAQIIGYDPTLRAGEDLTMLFTLLKLYRGYWLEDALTVYQEEQDVNLQKAIETNRSHFIQMQALYKQCLLSLADLSWWNLSFFLKILILVLLKPFSNLYTLSLPLRNYGSVADGWRLSEQQIDFIKSFREFGMPEK
jgi:glycosyltransferase involved in cell wall biosynthesis